MPCLITGSYRASAWCMAGVVIARWHGSRLFTLGAEPDAEHPLLSPSRYQYGDLAADPLAAKASLREASHRLDAAGVWAWTEGISPFPSLEPFDNNGHRVFFSRDEVHELTSQLRSPDDVANRGVLLVVGPSDAVNRHWSALCSCPPWRSSEPGIPCHRSCRATTQSQPSLESFSMAQGVCPWLGRLIPSAGG